MSTGVHLGIDAVGTTSGGGRIVVKNLMREVVEVPAISRATVFTSRGHDYELGKSGSEHCEIVQRRVDVDNYISRAKWLASGAGRKAESVGCDAILFLNGAGSTKSLRQLNFIQQSLLVSSKGRRLFPLSERFKLRVLREMTRCSLRTTDGIIVQTDVMATAVARELTAGSGRGPEIRKSFPVPSEVTSDFGNGCKSNDAGALDVLRRTAPDRRLLYVGSLQPHKHVRQTLIPAVRHAARRKPGLKLFVTASEKEMRDDLDVCEPLDYVPHSALGAIYRESTALVLPSVVETIGLPLVEAMSVGTPVIAAHEPYARDICGDAGLYFDTGSTEDLSRLIVRLVERDALRKDYMRRSRAQTEHLEKRPTWKSALSELLSQ